MIVFMISKRSVEFHCQLYSNALDEGWFTFVYVCVCVCTYIYNGCIPDYIHSTYVCVQAPYVCESIP